MNPKLYSWIQANKFEATNTLWGGVNLFLFSHQARALICVYIVSHCKNKVLCFFARKLLRSHYHIECSCRNIGYSLMLPHPRNIIIGAESIGDHVQINQNVTIGGNVKRKVKREWGEQKLPIIKNRVFIFTNAVVGGPVIIDDHVVIGSNCTCTHDVPAHSLVYNKLFVSDKFINVLDGTFEYQ